MANLKYTTTQSLEELFGMESGYVLEFSNNSFQRFVKGNIGIDIYQDKGYQDSCSKANKLRQIFESESNYKVSKLIKLAHFPRRSSHETRTRNARQNHEDGFRC